MSDLIDLKEDILDAIELLTRTGREAYKISGHKPGRAPSEFDPGEIAEGGWSDMLALCNTLEGCASLIRKAITPEILKAVKAEEEEIDRLAGMADGLSC